LWSKAASQLAKKPLMEISTEAVQEADITDGLTRLGTTDQEKSEVPSVFQLVETCLNHGVVLASSILFPGLQGLFAAKDIEEHVVVANSSKASKWVASLNDISKVDCAKHCLRERVVTQNKFVKNVYCVGDPSTELWPHINSSQLEVFWAGEPHSECEPSANTLAGVRW